MGERENALANLKKAAALEPGHARYSFVYAVALDSMGRRKEAIRVLESAFEIHPTDRDILFTLLQYHKESGDRKRAQTLARRFRQFWPDDPRSRQLAASGKNKKQE